MRRLKRTAQVMLLYVCTIFLSITYPLSVLAHADGDVPTDGAPSSVQASTPDTETSTTTPDTSTAADPAPDATDTPGASTPPADAAPSDALPVTTTPADTSTTTDSTTATATNTVDSTATTGDATVSKNTKAGSATTGNASASTTVINNVNSSVSAGSQPPANFVSNVYGDVQGDIILQPMIQQATLPVTTAPTSGSNLTVTNTSQLTNNITLTATSGDASVTNNTAAGNATTGSATAMANVVNIVNSMVSSGQSFYGTINIYGNLHGDILIAPNFIPQLLADNAQSDTPTQTLDAADTQAILNNVSLTAQSGAATVANNTTAGSATTGSAQTNLVILNLSGHQITASNSLLVFVNVLGQWVGVIVDAPVGTTAAAIGNGVTENNIIASGTTIATTTNTQINNNITVTAKSGDATVSGNTKAGDAVTGNATAGADIANISNDSLGLGGWFGVLFINVFGSWFGSFGVDTANGNPPAPSGGTAPTPIVGTQVMGFLPHQPSTKRVVSHGSATSSSATNVTPLTTAPATQAVLGAATSTPSHHAIQSSQAPAAFDGTVLIMALILVALAVAGARYFKKAA